MLKKKLWDNNKKEKKARDLGNEISRDGRFDARLNHPERSRRTNAIILARLPRISQLICSLLCCVATMVTVAGRGSVDGGTGQGETN